MTTTQQPETDILLEVQDLTVSLSGVLALDGVSLQVPRGSVVGIIGPNGAGKTSLLNCINGVYPPTSGRILFEGQDITNEPAFKRARRGIGRTFQNMELISDATVTTNLALGRHVHIKAGVLASAVSMGRSRREEARNREVVEEIISILGLGPLRDRRAGSLPAGQRKLLEVARALAMQPQLMLLDEPSGGMSHGERSLIAQQIVRIRDELGVTQMLIEHDLRFVQDLCDYIYVLNFGKVLTHGTPEVALSHSGVLEVYGGQAASA
jgi:branched-chain amino acid transport system ATP-binding protein